MPTKEEFERYIETLRKGKIDLNELRRLYTFARTAEDLEKVMALQKEMQTGMTSEELMEFNKAIIEDVGECVAFLDKIIEEAEDEKVKL